MSNILNAKYKPADLEDVTVKKKNLMLAQQEKWHKLLKKHETLFNGTFIQWVGDPYKVELKEGVKPYHVHPCPGPHAYKYTFCIEVDQLCMVCVIKKVDWSEWAAANFIIPKKITPLGSSWILESWTKVYKENCTQSQRYRTCYWS